MKKLFLYSVLISSTMFFASCKKQGDNVVPDLKDSLKTAYGNASDAPKGEIKDSIKGDKPGNNQNPPTTSPGTPVTCEGAVDLMAGQHTVSGNISVTSDASNLYVTYNTIDGWVLQETHLYVGDINNIPKGNGNFPYTTEGINNATSYTYTIPLSDLDGEACVAIAAHAVVVKLNEAGEEVGRETAWSNGNSIPSASNWSMYFDYCLCTEDSTGGNTGGGTDTGGDNDGDTGGDTGGPVFGG